MELKYGSNKGAMAMAAVGLIMVFTSTLMFVYNPMEYFLKMILNFSEGTIYYNLWSAPPYDVYFNLYIFNITNAEGFLRGEEKLNVSEVGPYSFREVLTNNNATFNETDGTLSFHPNREIIFVREKSVGDIHEDVIFTTNLALVGFQSYFSESSYFINLAFSTAGTALGAKPIINITVNDYIWGYPDKLVQYAHVLVPSWIDFDRLAIFERLLLRDNTNIITAVKDPSKYHSDTDHLLTEDERQAIFHVAKFNGLAGLKEWGFDELEPEELKRCDLIEGVYDGTFFSQNLQPNSSVQLFRNAFCRPVPLHFVRSKIHDAGFRAFEYDFPDDMFYANRSSNECYCRNRKCTDGIQNIAPCYYGIPLTLSQPHFLNTDPKVLAAVNGLHPDRKLHGSLCTIQPDVGVPLTGNLRIQINLEVGETKANAAVKPFNGLQVPLFWLEISNTEVPSIVQFLLQLICNVLPIVVEIVKYLLCIGGLALISGSALYALFKTRMTLPTGISLTNEYSSIPIISIPAEFLDKREKAITIK